MNLSTNRFSTIAGTFPSVDYILTFSDWTNNVEFVFFYGRNKQMFQNV